MSHKENGRKDYYRHLTRRMVLFVLAVSLAPLLVTGVITLLDFRGAYRVKVRDHLRELVQKHSQNIDRFLNDRLGNLRVLARSDDLARLKDEQYLKNMLQLMREEYGGAFVDLGLVNPQGRQVAYAGPLNLSGADYSQAPWFKQAAAAEYHVSDVFAGLRGTPHFIVSAKKGQGSDAHILRATINFEAFTALVTSIRIGQTGFAFIINAGGQFQTKPRHQVITDKGVYRELLAGRVSARNYPVIERPDVEGKNTIYALAPLKGGAWVLCVQQKAQDAYSEMYYTVYLAMAVILFSALGVVALSFLLSRRLVGRMEESDKEREIITQKVVETGRLASIGELAAGIAHEINNPVAIMVEEAGWIDDILSESASPGPEDLAEICRAVRQIRTQGDRCKDITYKLLSFARKTDPTQKPVDLNQLVGEVVALLTQKSRYAQVRLENRLQEPLPEVKVSPSEMQQVLLNLMNNAVDAIGPGGGKVTVATRSDGEKVYLTVSDTGIGIAEANLARIFDPFYTTKPVGQGTGLGLSICYGIVSKLGGDIKVESAKGVGTTFTVRLPLAKPSGRAGDQGRDNTPDSLNEGPTEEPRK